MSEVQAKRYAGPFVSVPFEDDFIQSPIGLVPKDGGTKTRLIFHLSYPRNTDKSVNARTKDKYKTVKYPDFDRAVKLCILEGIGCFAGKSDLTSAFRHLPINKKFWRYLVMKAVNPQDGKTYYFFDKCLPFGAAISCALFQSFSDALSHIVCFLYGRPNINYLDDYFFVNKLRKWCNDNLRLFLRICSNINFPVSMDKTVWGTTQISFLGLMIDTVLQVVRLPLDKLTKAISMLDFVLTKRNKKITLRQLQQLCGYLNFIGKAVVPGRAFTRRIYAHGKRLTKKHHHLRVTREVRMDLECWKMFLTSQEVVARPFFHFDDSIADVDINLYTDASRNPRLGCGGVFDNKHWFIMQWESNIIKHYNLSIAFLELYAAAVGILSWIGHQHAHKRVIIHCDNQSVVHMLNNTSSPIKECMYIIRLLVLHSMKFNTKIKCIYVPSKLNKFADLLSRLKYKQFWRAAKQQNVPFQNKPTPIPSELYPMSKWI